MASAGKPRRVLIIVENLPSPFDRRVWQEANTLVEDGYEVSIICPTGMGCEKKYEVINGIHIFRHSLILEAKGAVGYLLEYCEALFWEWTLTFKVLFKRGFDVIHACNPPDFIFVIGAFFKLFGKHYIFDHHDLNPELYEAKFHRKGIFHRLLLLAEWLTFKTADISIATNQSYRAIALERGKMDPSKVFVVRSGPDLSRLKIIPANASLKCGKRFLVGYVGVMGNQEGIHLLLEAIQHLVHTLNRRDIHFGLVGGGPALNEMKTLSKTLKIDEFVTFTGRAPDLELLEMLNTADVCVNPDVANEMNDKSTMNKIMEYMALGKPIVQFDLTEGRFTAEEASLYARHNDVVDLMDKILQLLDDPEACKRMGEYGRKRVETTLSWEYEAPKLLKAYETLFSDGG